MGQRIPAAQQHAESAFSLAQRGDLKGAEAELRSAIALAPNDSELLTSLGGILGMEGELRYAHTYLAKAVRINPSDPASRRNLAANEWQLGDLKNAQANLEHLLRSDPHDKVAIFLLGMVSEREKNYARSIRLLESIPDVVARQPEASVALASAYFHSARPGEAQAALKALPARGAKPQVLFMAGRVAIDAHEYALAESLLSGIRSTYPDQAAVDSQIALAQYRQGHAAESEQTLLNVIQSRHANQEDYLLLCKLLADHGAYDRALQAAKGALQDFPGSYQMLSAKAAIEMKLQFFSDAAASYEKAAAMHPSAEATRDLALAKWRSGDRKQAAALFEQGIRQFPRDAETCQQYGTLLLEDASPENKVRAEELLKRAVSLNDAAVEAHYQLANIDLENGKPDAAAEHLVKAIRSVANDSRFHFALSRAYRRMGRDADAGKEMQIYQKLKASAPAAARSDSAPGPQR